MTAISRLNVTSGDPINVETRENAATTNGKGNRIFVDSLKIADEEIEKNIVALDGGEELTNADSATAAGVIIAIEIEPQTINPAISLTLGVMIDSSLKTTLEEKISKISSGSIEDIKVELGSTNENQEYKTDDKWGLIMDLSSFELYPIADEFSFEIHKTDILGQGKKGLAYHIIEMRGLTTDETKLDVCSAESTAKGVYKLSSQDA